MKSSVSMVTVSSLKFSLFHCWIDLGFNKKSSFLKCPEFLDTYFFSVTAIRFCERRNNSVHVKLKPNR